MSQEVHERIRALVESQPVVLFMKGDREAPRCGFSAQVVQLLDRLLPEYRTVDVLADPELREGIKSFSDWPTIPQLYIGGEFQGGCDIVREMYEKGELHDSLGEERPSRQAPSVVITESARELLAEVRQQYGNEEIHLGIDARFRPSLGFGPAADWQIAVQCEDTTLWLDPESAARADGVVIDAIDTAAGPRLDIQNPNAPKSAAEVRPMTVQELARWREEGKEHYLLDVRTPEELAQAVIPGSVPFSEEVADDLGNLPKDTPIVFHCHHGARSLRAAERFAAAGFTEVYNLEGGIDAWSVAIDSDVPRY